MSTFCPSCSGSGESGQFGVLDCAALNCTAATERAALDAHLLALGRLHERDVAWEAYKLGQAKVALAWISTEDRLPPDETPVIALIDGIPEIAELRWEHPSHEETFTSFRYWDNPRDDGKDWDWRSVTHWMVIPDAAPANNNTEKADD